MNDISDLFKEKSILIIEDQIDALNLMCEIMTPIFAKVYAAKDGLSAVSIYEENDIHTVFCDIDLPKLNGFDVIEYIRKKDFNIPIIITSAYTDKRTLLKASNSNIHGFLEKPISFKDIKDILKKIALQFFNKNKNIIVLNDNIRFDLNTYDLIIDGESIPLTLKEKKLFSLFVKNINKPLSYEKIEDIVWTIDDKSMTMSSLRTLIKNVRKKIKYDLIKNVSKLGYKLEVK